MLTNVASVLPAPGSPQNKPANVLPIPWLTSSRLGLWRPCVTESAIRDVSRLSIDPSKAIVKAGVAASKRNPGETSGKRNSGMPTGIVSIIGASVSKKTPKTVPAVRAASVAGTHLPNIEGQSTFTPRVAAAMMKACTLNPAIASGMTRSVPVGPPVAGSAPRKGIICRMMMIRPIPDMKPEITE